MPPSGYSDEQVRLVVTFLKSCCEALEDEGRTRQMDAADAVEAECANIRLALESGDYDDSVSRPVLQMTLGLYEELLKVRPATYEALRDEAAALQRRLAEGLHNLHLPEIAPVKGRHR